MWIALAACGGKSKSVEPAPLPPDEPANSAPAERAPIAQTGLPGCDQYLALIVSFARCEKVPASSRDAAMQGAQALVDGWGDLSGMPEDARAQTDDACRQGADALHQGAEAMGCPLGVPEGDYIAEIRAYEGDGELGYQPTISPDADRMLTHCDQYVATVEQYIQCDKVPAEARDGAKAGIDAMKQGWGDLDAMPEDARLQTDSACMQAVDALHQGMDAMGCPY
jgi:hypothetical protein